MSYLFEALSPNFERNQAGRLARESEDFVPPEPGAFTGVLDPGLIGGAAQTIAADVSLAQDIVTFPLAAGADALLGTGDKFKDYWAREFVDPDIKLRKSAMVDPRTHGIAAQAVQGLLTLIPEAVVTGPVGVGVLSGLGEAVTQADDGKSAGTSLALGAAIGAVNALGVKLPAAAPVLKSIPIAPLAQRIITGTAGNVALGSAARGVRAEILDNAGYPAEAEQSRWNDAAGLAIDAILGAGFGALAHVQARPSDIDAALALNASRHAESTAPGLATSPEAANAHANALQEALNALQRGDEITAQVDEGLFIPDPVREARLSEMLATAGNRLTRADRQQLEFQRNDLTFKLTQFDNQAEQGGYTKTDFIEQARAENPREPARKIAKIAEQMAADAKANDRADLQAMLERTQKQLADDAVAREAFGDLDRGRLLDEVSQPETLTITDAARNGAAIDPEPLPVARTDATSPDNPQAKPDGDPQKTARGDESATTDTPEIAEARRLLETHADQPFTFTDEDGNEVTATLRELIDEVDRDAQDLNNIEAATTAAINCYLRFGDEV